MAEQVKFLERKKEEDERFKESNDDESNALSLIYASVLTNASAAQPQVSDESLGLLATNFSSRFVSQRIEKNASVYVQARGVFTRNATLWLLRLKYIFNRVDENTLQRAFDEVMTSPDWYVYVKRLFRDYDDVISSQYKKEYATHKVELDASKANVELWQKKGWVRFRSDDDTSFDPDALKYEWWRFTVEKYSYYCDPQWWTLAGFFRRVQLLIHQDALMHCMLKPTHLFPNA